MLTDKFVTKLNRKNIIKIKKKIKSIFRRSAAAKSVIQSLKISMTWNAKSKADKIDVYKGVCSISNCDESFMPFSNEIRPNAFSVSLMSG